MTLWKAAAASSRAPTDGGNRFAQRREISQVIRQRGRAAVARACDALSDRRSMSALLVTPLHALHREYGARFAPFAGYDMPIQYPRRHSRRARAHARQGRAVRRLAHGSGLARRAGSRSRRRARWRRCAPPTSSASPPGRQRYSQWLNDDGGVVDDFMATPAARRGRAACTGRQRRAQGCRLRAISPRACPRASR